MPPSTVVRARIGVRRTRWCFFTSPTHCAAAVGVGRASARFYLGILRKPNFLPDRDLAARLLIQACPLSAFFVSPLGERGRRPRPWSLVPSRPARPSPLPPSKPTAAWTDSARNRRRRRRVIVDGIPSTARWRRRRQRGSPPPRRRRPGRRPPRSGRHQYSMSRTSARKTK